VLQPPLFSGFFSAEIKANSCFLCGVNYAEQRFMIISCCVNAVLNILHAPFIIAIFSMQLICFGVFIFIYSEMTLNRD